MPTTREMDRQLQALYAQVPVISSCKGHCWISCSPLDMSNRERQRIAAAGYAITDGEKARGQLEEFWCEALGPDGRCRVYEMRPMICRLWGTSRLLPCPYGCVPDGGWVDDVQFFRLIALAMLAGGHDHGGLGMGATVEEVDRRLADPSFLAALRRVVKSKRGDGLRAQEHGTVLPIAVTSRAAPGLVRSQPLPRGGGSPARRASGRTARS